MKLSLHHVALVVDDIAAATSFYLSLGFMLEKSTNLSRPNPILNRLTGLNDIGAKVVLMKCDNAFMEIFEFTSSCDSIATNHVPNKYGIRHITLQVVKIEDYVNKCINNGGKVLGEIVHFPGAGTAVYCTDPFGNIIEFLHPAGTMPPV